MTFTLALIVLVAIPGVFFFDKIAQFTMEWVLTESPEVARKRIALQAAVADAQASEVEIELSEAKAA